MNQRIIYTTPEGGLAIIIPTGELSIEEILTKDVPAGAQAEIVDVSAIPSDRTFRAAWERRGQAIGHNMPKCKQIAHDRRRAARAAEFAPLDIEATIPAKASQAEAARQAIRDKYTVMQTAIDSAIKVEELKGILQQINSSTQ